MACFERAALLLGDEVWARDPSLANEAYLGGAEALVLLPRRATQVDFVPALLAHTRDAAVRADARRARISRHIVVNENELALAETRAALDELGVSIPEAPRPWHLLAALLEVQWALRGRSDADLAALPIADDPKVVCAQELLMRAGAAAYYAAPTLLPLLILRAMLLALRRGVCGASAVAFAGYTLLRVVLRSDVAGAARYAVLARGILERLDARNWIARTESTLGFWETRVSSLTGRADRYAEIYRLGIETGDFEFAALATFSHVLFGFVSGEALDELARRADKMRENASRLSHRRSELACLALQQTVGCLRGEARDPGVLDGEHWPFEARLREVEVTGLRSDVLSVHLWSAALRVHQGQYDLALGHLTDAERDLRSVLGAPQEFEFHLYASVARAMATGAAGRGARLRAARKSVKALGRLSASSPHNFGHMLALGEACVAAAEGREREATAGFDEAFRSAVRGGFTKDAALAAQVAAAYLIAANQMRAAAPFLVDARVQYARWGATAVLPRLEALAQALRAAGVEAERPALREPSGSHVDAVALARAAAALAGETSLRSLLERLARLLLEVGGARQATLVLTDEEGARVFAQADARAEGAEVTTTIEEVALSQAAPELEGVVAYTLRTGETLVLHDARRDARFPSADKLPPSVLAAPLMRGGRAVGAVVLTHDLAAGTFTAARAEFVALLASQASISIENAKLYDDLRAALDTQKALNRSIQRFIPHAFLQHLDKGSIVDIEPGDQVERTITVLFADIRGFSTLAEGLSADGTFRFINDYVRFVEPPIRAHHGFINQYLGDGIMALFPSSADDAVAGAIAMFEGLRRFNLTRDAAAGFVRIGAGLNTGDLILGTIGVSERLDCGVVGDAVNLAARIEGMTKTYDTPLVVSESTVRAMAHPERFSLREIDHVVAMGRRQSVRVYEVLDVETPARREAKRATLDDFQKARNDFVSQRFEAAIEGFQRCLARCPEDRPAQLLMQRCEALRGQTLPPDWDGVYKLTSK